MRREAETISLPDFIIIGAMKCGTSTLQDQLGHQPGVFVATPKEPNYFSNDDVYALGQEWYESIFAQAPQGALKGEASTHYTKLPTYPHTLERMQKVLPDPRLIYVIRNPITRAVSHFIHEWTEARVGDDMMAAFRENSEFADYGCYGAQITPFMEAYGAERILLTSLEQLVGDPDGEFARIATFLNLHSGARWHHDLAPQNISEERFRRIPFQSLLIEHPIARKVRQTLIPSALRERVRKARQLPARPEISPELTMQLHARFLEDRKVLARHFPAHPALDLCYPFATP